MGRLFGTDGIRGIANTDLAPELAVDLGRALVRTLQEEGVARPLVVIGRDPRASGEMLEAALVAGICSAGGDVLPLGVLPTPGVAHLTMHYGADSGGMISASHNPVGDNGIKFFGPDGYKLTDAEEDRIEQLIPGRGQEGGAGVAGPRPTGTAIGRVRPTGDALEPYVAHLAGSTDADCSPLSVVVDCAHGAASEVAPDVLRRLGCSVTAINAEPTGENINDRCGSTHPEGLAKTVTSEGADVGFAHDGDADRLIAVDHTGRIIDGDTILAVLAASARRERGLDTVVTTVMTNLGFTRAMDELGIDVIQTKVGDRYVLEAMRAGGHALGGEQSGHVILADLATTGDGILTAVQLLATMVSTGRTLADLAGVMQRLPQVLVNVPDVDRDRLGDAARLWDAVQAEERALDGAGRVLVRASGTEPLVRVMVEADTEDRAAAVADRLAVVAAEELRPAS